LLLSCSVSLYWSGMVLNDVCDADVDARERPLRPIPSGEVSLSTARRLGWGLLAVGLGMACLVSISAHNWTPFYVGTLLAVCIASYDSVLKRTHVAPVLMGTCRTLNLLLAMSTWNATLQPSHWAIAIGNGVYIAGVTVFGRTEARESRRLALTFGLLIMLVGIICLASSPDLSILQQTFGVAGRHWGTPWAVMIVFIILRCVSTIRHPEPRNVQSVVRNALQSLIVFDAILTMAWAGFDWAGVVLALLVPMIVLQHWFHTT